MAQHASVLDSERLLGIQALRFLAALAVVFHHSRTQMTWFDGGFDFRPFDKGGRGVDIFFVISGFVMVWVTRHGAVNPLAFIKRRLLRVWPLYALATALAGFLAFVAPRYYVGTPDVVYILKSMFFIPAYRANGGGLYPILVPGWSLNLEAVFYLVLGLAFFTRWPLVVASGALAAVYAVSVPFTEVNVLAAAYGGRNGILLELVLGLFIGVVHLRCRPLPRLIAWACILIGMLLLVINPEEGVLNAGLAAACLVLGAVNIPWNWRPQFNEAIDLLGRSSYALYLIHNFVIQSSTQGLRDLGLGRGDLPGWIFFCGVLLVSIPISVLIYKTIDEPLQQRFNSRSLKRQSAQAP